MKPLEAEEVAVVPNFNLPQFMGGWYVYERTDNWAEKGFKCSKDTYVMRPDGQSFDVLYTAQRDYPCLCKNFKLSMEAQLPDPAQPARQRHAPCMMQCGPANYFVVDTDYDNYAAIYCPITLACGVIKLYHAWVFTRDKNGPADRELLQDAYAAIERCGISRSQLVKIKQDRASL